MPRTAKAQRTDLNLPVATPPSSEYGQGVQLQQAQQQIPLPSNAGQVAALQQGAGAAAQQPGPTPPQAPPPAVMAGDFGAFNRPTENPAQHVMHGAPSGPGPNSTDLAQIPTQRISQTIGQLAAMTNNPDLQALAQNAQAQGQ